MGIVTIVLKQNYYNLLYSYFYGPDFRTSIFGELEK